MKPLTPRQLAFVAAYGNGRTSGTSAAIDAGYLAHSARTTAQKLLRNPHIRAELDALAAQVKERTAYTAEIAFEEAGQAIQFAKEKGNANAYVRAIELRARLHNLLTEKVDLDVRAMNVDIGAALAEARARIGVVPLPAIEHEDIAEARKRVGLPSMRHPAQVTEVECTAAPSTCERGTGDYESPSIAHRAPDVDA